MLIAIHVVPARQAHRLAGGQAVHAIDVAAGQRHLDGGRVIDADAAGLHAERGIRQRLALALSIQRPLLEIFNRHRRDGAQAAPAFVVVRQIRRAGLVLGIGADDDLVLIERAVSVLLVDHPCNRGVFSAIGEEYVDLITVRTKTAFHIAVVVRHGVLPGRAIGRRSRSNRPTRILDADVQAVQAHRTFDVVAGLFLRLGRLGGVGELVGNVRIQIGVRRRCCRALRILERLAGGLQVDVRTQQWLHLVQARAALAQIESRPVRAHQPGLAGGVLLDRAVAVSDAVGGPLAGDLGIVELALDRPLLNPDAMLSFAHRVLLGRDASPLEHCLPSLTLLLRQLDAGELLEHGLGDIVHAVRQVLEGIDVLVDDVVGEGVIVAGRITDRVPVAVVPTADVGARNVLAQVAGRLQLFARTLAGFDGLLDSRVEHAGHRAVDAGLGKLRRDLGRDDVAAIGRNDKVAAAARDRHRALGDLVESSARVQALERLLEPIAVALPAHAGLQRLGDGVECLLPAVGGLRGGFCRLRAVLLEVREEDAVSLLDAEIGCELRMSGARLFRRAADERCGLGECGFARGVGVRCGARDLRHHIIDFASQIGALALDVAGHLLRVEIALRQHALDIDLAQFLNGVGGNEDAPLEGGIVGVGLSRFATLARLQPRLLGRRGRLSRLRCWRDRLSDKSNIYCCLHLIA